MLAANTLSVASTGQIAADGTKGICGGSISGGGETDYWGSGGGGSGGLIWLRAGLATISGQVTAAGAAVPAGCSAPAAAGGTGRIFIDSPSVQGSTTPGYVAGSTTDGLPGNDTSNFAVKSISGLARITNLGSSSRSVRLVVAR